VERLINSGVNEESAMSRCNYIVYGEMSTAVVEHRYRSVYDVD
jgi:hypothetical protein